MPQKTKIMKQSQKVNIYLDKNIIKRKRTNRRAPGKTIKRGMQQPQQIVVNVPQYSNFQPQMPQPQPMFGQMPEYNKGAQQYYTNAISSSVKKEDTREQEQIKANIMPSIVAEPDELKALSKSVAQIKKENLERSLKNQQIIKDKQIKTEQLVNKNQFAENLLRRIKTERPEPIIYRDTPPPPPQIPIPDVMTTVRKRGLMEDIKKLEEIKQKTSASKIQKAFKNFKVAEEKTQDISGKFWNMSEGLLKKKRQDEGLFSLSELKNKNDQELKTLANSNNIAIATHGKQFSRTEIIKNIISEQQKKKVGRPKKT